MCLEDRQAVWQILLDVGADSNLIDAVSKLLNPYHHLVQTVLLVLFGLLKLFWKCKGNLDINGNVGLNSWEMGQMVYNYKRVVKGGDTWARLGCMTIKG